MIEVKAKRVLCIVCIVAIANLMFQLTAMANQRRYRMAFYSSLASIAFSVVLVIIEDGVNYYLYCYQAGYLNNEMIEAAPEDWPEQQVDLVRSMTISRGDPISHIWSVMLLKSSDF